MLRPGGSSAFNKSDVLLLNVGYKRINRAGIRVKK